MILFSFPTKMVLLMIIKLQKVELPLLLNHANLFVCFHRTTNVGNNLKVKNKARQIDI